jgi:hypothetical protein
MGRQSSTHKRDGNSYKILARESDGPLPSTHRWEGNIKMEGKEMTGDGRMEKIA